MTIKKLLLATTLVSGLALASAANAAITVYVGYADNLRANGFFPSPWIGDANVVSNDPGNQVFDSGAIRITNNGATSITVSNMSVTMNGGGGPTYAIWSNLVIGAGQDGVWAQNNGENFDSSDNSPNGSPPGGIQATDPGSNGIGGCSSTVAAQTAASILATCLANQPILSFDIGADHFSFHDTGHILDTGYYDFVNNNVDQNESIQWNLVGTGPNRGGSAPEPAAWALMLLGFGGLGAALRRGRVAFA